LLATHLLDFFWDRAKGGLSDTVECQDKHSFEFWRPTPLRLLSLKLLVDGTWVLALPSWVRRITDISVSGSRSSVALFLLLYPVEGMSPRPSHLFVDTVCATKMVRNSRILPAIRF